MRKFLTIIITLLALSACAIPTPYQKVGFLGGFSETKLSENVYRVHFQGNDDTSKERVSDFTLLRSAELTLENGFKYFETVDNKSSEQIGFVTYSGGGISSYSKPQGDSTIMCYKKKPKDKNFVFDADFVRDSIRKKYNLVSQ